MEINIKKAKKMIASRKQPVPDITIDGTPFKQVASVIYLEHFVTDGGNVMGNKTIPN